MDADQALRKAIEAHARLQKAQDEMDQAVRQRDKYIQLAREKRVPVTEIANALGLNRNRVHQVLARLAERDRMTLAEREAVS